MQCGVAGVTPEGYVKVIAYYVYDERDKNEKTIPIYIPKDEWVLTNVDAYCRELLAPIGFIFTGYDLPH